MKNKRKPSLKRGPHPAAIKSRGIFSYNQLYNMDSTLLTYYYIKI